MDATATVTRAGPPRRSVAPPVGYSRRELAAIAALTIAALLLRATSLSRSLFSDEAYSLALAQRSFGHMITLFGYEANGTPYPIVLWPLIRLFGSSETVLRLPAVVAGAASVPALWWAARRFASPAVALLAAALLALNPMAVWYSQTARQYAFVMLAACLAFGTLARALRPGSGRRAWFGYVAAMALLAYSEIFAAPLVLPAQALMLRPAGRVERKRWLWSLLAVLACCLPLLVAAGIERSRRNALYWLPKPDRTLFVMALQEFSAGFSELKGVRWATLAAGALLVAAALWRMRHASAAREDSDNTRAWTPFAVAFCWGVLPGALLLAISFVQPVFWPRYAIVALPGLCLLAALAAGYVWSTRRGAVLSVGCVTIILAAGAIADAHQRRHLEQNWPPIAAWLRADRTAGQPTIVDNALVLAPMGYYDPAFSGRDGDLIVSEWQDQPLPRGFVGYKDRASYGRVAVGPPSAATFARLALLGHGSVWLIVSQIDEELQSNPRDGEAVAWARSHCKVQVHESTGVWALRAIGCRAERLPVRAR